MALGFGGKSSTCKQRKIGDKEIYIYIHCRNNESEHNTVTKIHIFRGNDNALKGGSTVVITEVQYVIIVEIND